MTGPRVPFPRFKRAVVIGAPGAGKSSFAVSLGQATGLSVIHLDQLYWSANWTEVPAAQFRDRVRKAAAGDVWIIDGNYVATMGLRLARADVVFWLTHGRLTCMRRVLGRTIMGYGRSRSDMAPGCPERFDTQFLGYVWRYHRTYPALIEGLIAQYGLQLRTVRLASDAESHHFLRQLTLDWSHEHVLDPPPHRP